MVFERVTLESQKEFYKLLPCEKCKQSIEQCNKRCRVEKIIKDTLRYIKLPASLTFPECLLLYYVKTLKDITLAKQVAFSFAKYIDIDEQEIEKARRRLKYHKWI